MERAIPVSFAISSGLRDFAILEGRKEGRKESQTEIILNMAKSLSPEEIAKLTGIALFLHNGRGLAIIDVEKTYNQIQHRSLFW